MAWNFPIPEDVQRALVRLRSLKDGDLGVIEIVACGSRAVPVLRALLFEREPSGLYQTRCRAVQALAALRANETLIDFLSAPSDIADPVERIGEDAVINAAALAVAAGLGEERVFQLLMSLADNRLLPGVVGALGMFERVEALPFLVEALAEDESRPTAETALRRLGAKARQSLLVVATRRPPSQDRESESSLRQRRSALQLLLDIGIRPETWPVLRHLPREQDAKIAMLACEICLASGATSEKRTAVRRLLNLLSSANFMLSEEIERCLAVHFDDARELIADALVTEELASNDPSKKSSMARALLRIKGHAEAFSQKGNG